MDPQWIPVVQTALIVIAAVLILWLGARAIRRDARQASVVPGIEARIVGVQTALEAFRDAQAEQRLSDLDAQRARLDAIQALAEGADDAAKKARRIASRREVEKAKREEAPDAQLTLGFRTGVGVNGQPPPRPLPHQHEATPANGAVPVSVEEG